MSSPTLPKYTYAILVVQAVSVTAGIVFLILDEYRLWAYAYLLLMLFSAIQYCRLRRARRQLEQELVHITEKIERRRQNKVLTICELQDMDAALEGLREDIERHRIAKDDSQLEYRD